MPKNISMKAPRVKRYAMLILMLCSLLAAAWSQAESWRSIGLTYLKSGEAEKAIPFFRLAVSSDGSRADYREELAYALQENKEYEESLTEYTAALGLPNAAVANIKYNMALVYAALGDYATARATISEVIALKPEISSAVLTRANFSVRMELYSEAKKDYEQYLVMEPNDAQREDIARMIALLDDMQAAKDAQDKLAREQRERVQQELRDQRKKLDLLLQTIDIER